MSKVQFSLRELTDKYFMVYWYRRHLDIAAKDILGLKLAAHHAIILRDWGRGKKINHLRSSRGMGKTVLLAIFFLLACILYPRLKVVVAAGTAFRGSKFFLMEIERIVQRVLSGQEDVEYAKSCMVDPKKPITKDPSWWYIRFTNGSLIYGLPLGANSEGGNIRGPRGHYLGLDEAFLIPTVVKQAALDPMRNVLYDMRKPHDEQLIKNSEYSVSTIDYDFRDFWKLGEFYKSILESDEDEVEYEGTRLKKADVSFFDFNFEDSKYTHNSKHIFEWGIDYNSIHQQRQAPNADDALWLSENKNVPMNITGGYFDYTAIERGQSVTLREKPEEMPQVLDSCPAPCILGVDTAPSGDNTAFCLIKAGSYENAMDIEKCKVANMGEPCPLLKNSKCLYKRHVPVLSSYEENKMSQKDRVIKIYEYRELYNIIAIAMDRRGGGAELADLLKDKTYIDSVINNNPEVDIYDALPIYDPEDGDIPNALPILTMYSTTQDMNLEFNGYLRSLIASNTMLFPKPLRARPDNPRVLEAAGHVEKLLHQLARIKAVPRGKSVSFEIETIDPKSGLKKSGKKDLYSSLIYASAKLRDLINESRSNVIFVEELPDVVSFNL